MDSEGGRPSGSCTLDGQWGSERAHWIVRERLASLDRSEGCLGSCLMILALPASGRPLGATVSGSVILERHRTEPRPALDFQEPHQALIKRSFSKENLHLSASQCGDPLRILDSGFEEDLPVLGGLAEDPKSKIPLCGRPPPQITKKKGLSEAWPPAIQLPCWAH